MGKPQHRGRVTPKKVRLPECRNRGGQSCLFTSFERKTDKDTGAVIYEGAICSWCNRTKSRAFHDRWGDKPLANRSSEAPGSAESAPNPGVGA